MSCKTCTLTKGLFYSGDAPSKNWMRAVLFMLSVALWTTSIHFLVIGSQHLSKVNDITAILLFMAMLVGFAGMIIACVACHHCVGRVFIFSQAWHGKGRDMCQRASASGKPREYAAKQIVNSNRPEAS